MKSVPLGMVVVAAATGLLGFLPSVRAQGDGEPVAIVSRATAASVDYGNETVFAPIKHGTDFERLGVRAEQTLTIVVQFPPEPAGQFIIAEPLDGGAVGVPDEGLFVGSDGSVAFQFQTGASFGSYRVAVHQPDDSNFVQFWVVDPDHPENTPPDLPGSF